MNLINFFKSNKSSQFILSAYKQDDLLTMVKDRNLDPYFNKVLGISDNRAGSKVEIGVTLLKNSTIDPSKTLFIGDTTHDYDVAKDLELDCIIVASGHNSRKQLEEYGIDLVVDSLQELLQ